MRRLMALDGEGRLTTDDVRLTADGLAVSQRTVWRWIERARSSAELNAVARDHFVVTDLLRERLAFWRGNVSAVHRELVDEARRTGAVTVSRQTLQRAVERDVLRGDRAGLRDGEHARRGHDVFLQRPRPHRNEAWESDHVEAPVEVDVEGRLVKPWVTWFVDVGTNAVCGTAVTPGVPSRESILAALRAAITLEAPYGPPGGLPERVRIDRGKDFLSDTVRSVLAGFAVRVVRLPAYTPHLKGTVETVNGAAAQMFFAGLPRYTGAQKLANGRSIDPDAPALTFEAFVTELLGWVRWWNTEHPMPVLEGVTPLQAWLDDPTPLTTVPTGDLRLLTLEDDGRTRKITTKGVSWRARQYVAAWMTGQVGRQVRLRHMPHHDHEVEVFDASTGEHLGAATLADMASSEQIGELRRTREARRRQLQADLRKAEKARRIRYAAVTTAVPPQPISTVTVAQATAELSDADDQQLQAVARPLLVPLRPPAPGWVLPRPPREKTNRAFDEDSGGEERR
ncbi:Mu transposase C-terminal domain-containing protein [Cryobacterium lactosi]|uniref:Mu transposase C-terminal domain-containing protein n=1 Tax=Cryobacterium lactosi TaxID=1259202 RepID=UPI001F53FE0A|nr:Mu transposase C-terminal domain-containing protein [Cryobacterium lactosi]